MSVDALCSRESDWRVLMVDVNWQGGIALYTKDLCDNIARQGTEVTLLTSSAYPEQPCEGSYKITRKLRPFHPDKRFFTKIHWMADRFSTAFYNGLVRNRQVHKGNFDLVHFQNVIAPVDQFLLRALRGKIPLILTVHDTVPHYDRFIQRYSFLKRVYKYFDRLIVHYDGGVTNLVKVYGVPEERIEVIPHGLSLKESLPLQEDARRKLALDPNKKVLLFFGAIRPDKGLGTLLRAMSQARENITNVELVVAGCMPRGMSFAQYNKLIKSLGLTEYVKPFIRFIKEEEVSDFFAAADICVLPYNRFDSQSGVLMQAYAHYKPILTTDVGAIGTMVRKDGVGVVAKPGDAGSLADGLREILRNYDKYLQKCGKEVVGKYTWANVARMTVALYRSFLSSR